MPCLASLLVVLLPGNGLLAYWECCINEYENKNAENAKLTRVVPFQLFAIIHEWPREGTFLYIRAFEPLSLLRPSSTLLCKLK